MGLSARGLVGERRALLARPIGANAQLIGIFPRGDLEARGAAKTAGTGYCEQEMTQLSPVRMAA